jgi:hypothetical protein
MIACIVFALSTGFVNLPQLVAAHPLAPVLAQYDREIAALRATEHVAGLSAVARSVAGDANAVRTQATAASGQVRKAAANATSYDEREAAVLRRLSADGTENAAAYDRSARDAAAATLQRYRSAMAQRTARALAARRQQLSEAESTLAFDLEKQDAGRRLTLELKLRDLHLQPAQRSQLRAQLSALDAREAATVEAHRRNDAATLDAYAATLRAQESTDDARMASDVTRATAANVATRRTMLAGTPDVRALRGYRLSADAADIEAGCSGAGSDLTQRFATLERIDRSSHASTEARIEQIEANRNALYREILAQITADAREAARSRHLRSVLFGAAQPRDAVDLTTAVRSKLRSVSH